MTGSVNGYPYPWQQGQSYQAMPSQAWQQMVAQRQQQFQTDFTQSDTDGDGTLSLPEFTNFMSLMSSQQPGAQGPSPQVDQMAQNMFGKIDANGDGQISQNELMAFRQKHHHGHHRRCHGGEGMFNPNGANGPANMTGTSAIDPTTGMPLDSSTSLIDPGTGLPISSANGLIDPTTGLPISSDGTANYQSLGLTGGDTTDLSGLNLSGIPSSLTFDANGNIIDPSTGLPLNQTAQPTS